MSNVIENLKYFHCQSSEQFFSQYIFFLLYTYINIGNIVSVYGNVNDQFVLPNLKLAPIDEALLVSLKAKKFELVILFRNL